MDGQYAADWCDGIHIGLAEIGAEAHHECMGTMVFNGNAQIRNEELKRLSLLVALDMADISDDLEAVGIETDPGERKGLRSEARAFLESAAIYDVTLKRLKGDGRLNVAEVAEADRLLQGVAIIVATGKAILHKAR